jgi:hypothetical protein
LGSFEENQTHTKKVCSAKEDEGIFFTECPIAGACHQYTEQKWLLSCPQRLQQNMLRQRGQTLSLCLTTTAGQKDSFFQEVCRRIYNQNQENFIGSSKIKGPSPPDAVFRYTMGNTAPVAETSWKVTYITKANADRREKEACRLMTTKLYSLALDEWKGVLGIRRHLHGGNLFKTSTVFKEIGTCYYWMGSQSCAIAAWHLYYRACSIDSTIHSTLFGRVLLALHAWTDDDMQYYDQHAPISVSHEKRGDKHRRRGDYDGAIKEYKMAIQVETTFKFPLENPVVAHLVRKVACVYLDKAKTVARQKTSSDDDSLDSTKSNSLNNKEWIQYSGLISLGDLKFGQHKWLDAVHAYLRPIQILTNQALRRNNHDQAPSTITTGVLPSPLLNTSRPEPYYNISIAWPLFWSILGFMIGICFMIPRRLSMPESEGNGGRSEDLLLLLLLSEPM